GDRPRHRLGAAARARGSRGPPAEMGRAGEEQAPGTAPFGAETWRHLGTVETRGIVPQGRMRLEGGAKLPEGPALQQRDAVEANVRISAQGIEQLERAPARIDLVVSRLELALAAEGTGEQLEAPGIRQYARLVQSAR